MNVIDNGRSRVHDSGIMRYKVIACRVFWRELSLLSARSSVSLDVTWIQQGLHNYPDLLRDEIQGEIDRAEDTPTGPTSITTPPEDYAGVILGFGLCSGAVTGVRSHRLPLILPRSHDCIALLLGSRCRYNEELRREPATYWFSPGWLEEASLPAGGQRDLIAARLRHLYGGDNSEYLVELARSSLSDYRRANLIQWPELLREDRLERVHALAADFGWRVENLTGDAAWLTRIVEGEWTAEDVATARPGETFAADTDGEVVKVISADGSRLERYA